MSGGGGGSRGNGVAAAGGIPGAARKMVQSIKEIVNCTEAEIYAMLKECNMDPSEAVHRLLSQDTFHEVKSKREKKKETKDTPDLRSRAMTSISTRGGRVGTERSGRGTSTQFSLNDSGATRAKPIQKKEHAEIFVPISNSASGAAGYSSRSDSAYVENTLQASGVADGVSLPSQPAMGSQSSWFGVPGRRSMADIVKMGRPLGKPLGSSTVTIDSSYTSPGMPNISNQEIWPSVSSLPSGSNMELHSYTDPVSNVAEISHELAVAVGQHSSHNDWSLVDESPMGNVLNVSQTSAIYADLSSSSARAADGANLLLNPHTDELQVLEDSVNGENSLTEPIRSVSVSDRQHQVDHSENNSCLEDDSLRSISYPSQSLEFEHHEVEDGNLEISSATANLQQLSLHNEDLAALNAKNNPAVIIPNHLQVTNAECSHLSFGSFGSGISAAFSGSLPSKSVKSNIDVAPLVDDASATDHSDIRNPEYYDNGQLTSTSDENVVPTTATSVREYDTPSASQPDVIRSDTLEASHVLQYNFPSVSGYTLSGTSPPNAAAYSLQQSHSQMQNLARFSSLMQPYGNAMPNNSLASALQNVPNLDFALSPLLTTQPLPTKYSTSMSSISGSAISMPEPVKEGVFSSSQPTQNFHSTSIASSPGLPQPLPVHPYSQPSLPLGHFANMVGYPYLPQSYAYLQPAAFQQAYTGNGAFHQSPTAVHNTGIKYSVPQYKSSVATSLPQSAAVAPGYGGFGSSSNIPGNYILNPSTASASSSIGGFDEAFLAQYKEGNQYLSQQNENPQMWLQGAGSRTVSAIPASTIINILGQNQLSGYRQVQQPTQFTNPGYPNFYHSHAVASQEHQQNPHDGNLNGSQGGPSQHSHQIWQHS